MTKLVNRLIHGAVLSGGLPFVAKGEPIMTTRWILAAALATGTALTGQSVNADRSCDNVTASRDALRDSFQCNMDLRDADRPPVILVPGTTFTPEVNFSWNYVPALDALGWPVCTVELPESSLANIQRSAEHIEYAIREGFRLSGHKVQVIGFSQGGMAPRWPLRFSPDTRRKVQDLISLSGSHHGVFGADLLCGPFASPDPDGVVGCEAALWQQGVNSDFINALNGGYETVPDVDYTAIYTLFDDVLPSNGGPMPTSALAEEGENVLNITLQEVCPANTADHRAIGTFDPVGFAIALDALLHDGPASLERVLGGYAPGESPICLEEVMPGVDPADLDYNLARYDLFFAQGLTNGVHLVEEPLAACYTRGDGPPR